MRQTIPGWPYSILAVLESGRSSWILPLDAVRLAPDDDATEVTATQIRELVGHLRQAGQLTAGDPPLLVVCDAGYDVTRLAYLLSDLPVALLGRLRSNRRFTAHPHPADRASPAAPPATAPKSTSTNPTPTPPRHTTAHGTHPRYGAYHLRAFGHLHPQLTRRGGWENHTGQPPIITGTAIGVEVQRLPAQTHVAVVLQPPPRPARPVPPVLPLPAPLRS